MPGVFFAGFASDRQPRALRGTLPFVVDATEKTIRLRARAHDGQVAHVRKLLQSCEVIVVCVVHTRQTSRFMKN